MWNNFILTVCKRWNGRITVKRVERAQVLMFPPKINSIVTTKKRLNKNHTKHFTLHLKNDLLIRERYEYFAGRSVFIQTFWSCTQTAFKWLTKFVEWKNENEKKKIEIRSECVSIFMQLQIVFHCLSNEIIY